MDILSTGNLCAKSCRSNPKIFLGHIPAVKRSQKKSPPPGPGRRGNRALSVRKAHRALPVQPRHGRVRPHPGIRPLREFKIFLC
ncbi:hypothetical protein [Fibrobacter intestinalis]|uniref:hypothetical protein n=1 Tax=Fibrobacter intestinalis TaxID=28122 RepID=UPI0009355990|nr:hypothetical protein [Fibrobacter intestinalis]MDD7300310.1 hypothetical protein [Fibrobacter intestinalis]